MSTASTKKNPLKTGHKQRVAALKKTRVKQARIRLSLQMEHATVHTVPSQRQCVRWVKAALEKTLRQKSKKERRIGLSLRIVGATESARLNKQFRAKNKATNVLSFPDEPIPGEQRPVFYLGDLAICATVVEREAREQNKSIRDHFAHLLIHGVLHLLGYDHLKTPEAIQMERLEIRILAGLGIKNPYRENGSDD